MDQRLAEVSKSLQVPGRIEGRTMGMHIYIYKQVGRHRIILAIYTVLILKIDGLFLET